MDPDRRKRGHLRWFLACLAIYLAAVSAFGIFSYERQKTELLKDVDNALLQTARSLKYILAPDFHDRALAPDSISFEEELRNRRSVTAFGTEAGFKWVYTLAERGGRFYFSAPSVSPQEASARRSWYFYPYEDVPPAFVRAFTERRTVFIDYTDQWGQFRSVALPQVSPGGRPYLACADYETSHIEGALHHNVLESVLTILFFTGCALPFAWLFRSERAELRRTNVDLTFHKDRLEELVQIRTRELEGEKCRLEEALADVRTLRGLIPICSACKQIRDDQGFWNQFERYVEAHSDAEFTHGICPECARKLYPDFPADS